MKKVGVFGGSFDPVHFGHLGLAIALKEAASLDRVLFVPAQVSPFKIDHPPLTSGEHRLEMLKLAIQGIVGFEVQDLELKRSAPSYTIDTIRELSLDPSLQLHLLLAEDLVPHFFSWKEASLLIQLAPPLIGVRKGSSPPFSCNWGRLIQTPCLEISSTQIRERLSKKLYCGHLAPFPVLEYIHHHQLYE